MAELSQHPDVVDLAEYAEGLLDDSRRAAIDDHVRGCPDCAQTLADLRRLPEALAAAPMPPMPADVADRLDRAIAAESQARASGWSGAAAQVTPLQPRSRRRWLAPLATAAAVLGAIAIAVPVLNNSDSDDSGTDVTASSESDEAYGSGEPDGAGGPPESRPEVKVPAAQGAAVLTSDSFEKDVLIAFYYEKALADPSDLRLSTSTRATDYYADTLAAVEDPCEASSVPDGTIDDVTYNGKAARLLRQESGRTVDAIAFRCVDGEPDLLDATTLDLRD